LLGASENDGFAPEWALVLMTSFYFHSEQDLFRVEVRVGWLVICTPKKIKENDLLFALKNDLLLKFHICFSLCLSHRP
jgi:hypothetical protein